MFWKIQPSIEKNGIEKINCERSKLRWWEKWNYVPQYNFFVFLQLNFFLLQQKILALVPCLYITGITKVVEELFFVVHSFDWEYLSNQHWMDKNVLMKTMRHQKQKVKLIWFDGRNL